MEKPVRLNVNGRDYTVAVEPHRTLIEVLRDQLNLTGVKYGCGTGECGACTVLVDGEPILSCMTLAVAVNGKNILTIEGVAEGEKLHPIQQALVDNGGVHCGFCTPGIILSAKALLDRKPNPTLEEVKEAIAGNLCRCTGYIKIIQAILNAAKIMRGE